MANQMTKAQLVAAIAEATGSDRKSTAAALDALTTIITREVAAGGAVTLPGIGRIYCRERPARQVRNPSTGEIIAKPADKAVKIAVAKALKDSVNG
jgi:DNA-binding protein HU-beta